ncbi:RNA polymerase-binding protein DksA [Marinobacterium nitratireducens]|uniref:RNA polymerase-binding protein DksA n=1 Tax=Marinobacterium nitratireducens TaxID=518897 RepID=A0A918DR79_9GAMM|nr:TraR/DksA family transcriptional regulator [Marinobacterium nitratireducens]GGO80847.1 RNA polymerase-binding protein DksA [Marinobacterium nitratireducens]
MEQNLQDEHLQQVEQALRKLQRDLNEEIEGLREVLESGSGERKQYDTSERSDALQQNSMAKANLSACERRLRQVHIALRRIAEGDEDFGYCSSCDAEIPFARLRVRPESPLCLSCQQKQESR